MARRPSTEAGLPSSGSSVELDTIGYQTLKTCNEKIIAGLAKEPKTMADALLGRGFISTDLLSELTEIPATRKENARKLYLSVLDSVQHHTHRYSEFLSILCKNTLLYGDLLKAMEDVYQQKMSQSMSPITTSASDQSLALVSDSQDFVSSSADESADDVVQTFEARFHSLRTSALSEVSKNGVTVAQFRQTIMTLPHAISNEHKNFILENYTFFKQAESIEDIFVHLNFYLSFLDFSLLEHIIQHFGSPELRQNMEKYSQDMEKFRKHTRVADVLPHLSGRPEPPPHFVQLTVKLDVDVKTCTLEDLEQSRRRFGREFSLSKFTLFLVELKEGSLVQVFLVPSDVVPMLKENFEKTNASFFLSQKILKVSAFLSSAPAIDVYSADPSVTTTKGEIYTFYPLAEVSTTKPPSAVVGESSKRQDRPSSTSVSLMSPTQSVVDLQPTLETRSSSQDGLITSKPFKEHVTQKKHVNRFSEDLKKASKKIGVYYPVGRESTQAEEIARYLNGLLSDGKSVAKVYETGVDGQDWLSIAADEGISHYVFIGPPPVRHVQQTDKLEKGKDFFDQHQNQGKRISEVVFVESPPGSLFKSHPKQVKGFLVLDGDLEPHILAERMLDHFDATQPLPHAIDNAYWSSVPKLINVNKYPEGQPLGISLVTREMSPMSAFPRITLIKSLNEDCVADLRGKVGRYSHIQSINGHCLDGLDIRGVSDVFKEEVKKVHTQLMVRYIHSASKQKKGARLDKTQEDLPTPVFILSDFHQTAKKLFTLLTTELSPNERSTLHVPTPPAISQPGRVSSVRSGDSGYGTRSESSSARSEVEGIAPAKSEGFTLHVPTHPATSQLKSDISETQTPDSGYGTPGDPLSTLRQDKIKPYIESDKYVNRASISSSLVNSFIPIPTSSLESLMIADKHYIPQHFGADFDRYFAHIYLRDSGIYLLTAELKDLADDPLIQYENLSYWLRLIQSRTGCRSNVKRVIIVGMYDGSEEDELVQIQHYVQILNAILEDSKFKGQIYDQNRSEHLYVFMFDVNRPTESSQELYACMEECSDFFTEKLYHFDLPSFESVFLAFDGLNVSLRMLSSMTAPVGRSRDLETLCSDKPPYAHKTLEAYSTALVGSTKQDIPMNPEFLIDVVKSLDTPKDTSLYSDHDVPEKALKTLPVVNGSWLSYVVKEKSDRPLDEYSKQAVIDWAVRLGLVFKMERNGPKKSVYYFVPFLASPAMEESIKYHWDENEERFYKSPEATVLFAYLHFPADHQFFHGVIAELLKDGFTKGMKLFINIGCTEAILPLSLVDTKGTLSVFLIYHPLQNVIEFRTRLSEPIQVSFLKAVKHTLSCAYSSSNVNFDKTVTFHIPSDDYDTRVTSSALLRLWEFEKRQAEERGDEAEQVLLKTRELTPREVVENWL